MSEWLLIAWLATDPRASISLGIYATRESCETRVMWLDESRRRRSVRREYGCIELPDAKASLPRASLGRGDTEGQGGRESLELLGAWNRAGVKRAPRLK